MEKEKMENKLKAARVRKLAALQRDMADSYTRQAGHPIYPGQDVVCAGKAKISLACAEELEAKADLLAGENEFITTEQMIAYLDMVGIDDVAWAAYRERVAGDITTEQLIAYLDMGIDDVTWAAYRGREVEDITTQQLEEK